VLPVVGEASRRIARVGDSGFPPNPSSERISMCYIKYMAGTYTIHSTVHPIVSIKGATLVTITSSRGLSVIISLLVPGRDGLFGNSVC
jgi:hypothetical protein